MTHLSSQRHWSGEASRLNNEASKALQPLHDDLQAISPSFDGIVYFAVDRWHENNASAVATVQPNSDDTERFAFYKQNIARHRVDLGASALGLALQMDEPTLLKSRMNPDKHITWAHRSIIDDTVVGGVQAAFNRDYGKTPKDSRAIQKAWDAHAHTVQEVAAEFRNLSDKTTSVGDTLELLAPATPNGFIVSWDLDGSTKRAKKQYGSLRNYLIDTKDMFERETAPLKTHFHDTGDGQDITFWLPDGVDRANEQSIRRFGQRTILPLLDHLSAEHRRLVEGDGDEQKGYADIAPEIHLAVGLGYVERDKRDERTSQEYWNIATLHESETLETTFTENALRVLGPILDNKKYPQ